MSSIQRRLQWLRLPRGPHARVPQAAAAAELAQQALRRAQRPKAAASQMQTQPTHPTSGQVAGWLGQLLLQEVLPVRQCGAGLWPWHMPWMCWGQ